MQPGKGPIPVLTREERRRFQRRVAAGLRFQGGDGKELFGPGKVLPLLQGEHQRDKPRGSLTVRSNSGCTTSTVSTRQVEHRVSSSCQLAESEELLLGTSEKILKATLLPEGEALGHQGEDSWSSERPSSSRAKSSLPRAMPCHRCAVAAIKRRRHLEGMWSKVMANNKRILWVKSVGSGSWGVRRVRREWMQRCHPRRQPHQRRLWARRGPHDDIAHSQRSCWSDLSTHSRARKSEAAA